MTVEVRLENCFLSYPHLFTPRRVNEKSDPKYSANLILPPSFNWTPVQLAVEEAIATKFGNKVPTNLAMPWDIVEDGPYAGYYQIKASSQAERPPRVVTQDRRDAGPHEQQMFFPGAVVNAYVRMFGYDTAGNRGVAAGLNGIQLVNCGNDLPRLDSSKTAEQMFDVVPGAPAPTAQHPGMPAQGQPMQPQYPPQGQPQYPPQGQQYPPQGQPQQYPQQYPPQGQPMQPQYPQQGQPPMGAGPGGYPAQGPTGAPAPQHNAMPWNQ
jgi:hypothetical protein